MPGPLSLGIAPLDRILSAPPEGSTTLLLNDPGVEPDAFLFQAAASHLDAGRTVLLVVTSRSTDSVLEGMGAYGFAPTEEQQKRLFFVDAFGALMGIPGGGDYTIDDPHDLEAYAKVLERAAQDHPGAVLVFDSLSTLIDHTDVQVFTEALPALLRGLRRFTLAITSFTLWPYEGLNELLPEFDAVVALKGVQERVLFGHYMEIERATWNREAEARRSLYKTIKPGGVFVYIPKIVVTGPYNAGKSTFIHAVSDTAVSVDRLGTTVALDHGHVTLDGLTADIFGTPGQARFDPILRTVAGQALGVIVVVDSTKPDSFARARELLEKTWERGLPALIVANKQDLPNALSPDDVAERLGAPAYAKVIGCTGQDRASARKVLQAMTDHIMLRKVVA